MNKEIESIKKRNKRVEADKAWEISKTRKSIIAVLTYLVIVIFLILINAPNPWFNAFIPVVGFILSTMTLSFIKEWWTKEIYKK